MGRYNRAIDPERSYHVTCRGSNREQIVWDRDDCERFRAELDRVATKFEWEVYAWCLMPNHHHVTLRARQEQFSAGFQQLNGNHARRTNRRHGRTDHLFRNRPRAVELVDTAHLVGAIAYVVRNPVKAKIVEHAAEWPWSSYRATAGIEYAPEWLLIDEVRKLFGHDPASAVAAFAEQVHSGRLLVSDTRGQLSSVSHRRLALTTE
jgi:REP element-mobilizing transposase RayT